MAENNFNELYQINVNDKVEQKNGLSYLSWAWAWAEIKKRYPDAHYTIERFGEGKKPYLFDEELGYMVFTSMTINGLTHEMWLPVMNNANKAMKNKPYTYKVKVWNNNIRKYETVEKLVDSATMFDINTAIMRCLTKNISMFGLGLYIYAGEDLPEDIEQTKQTEEKKTEPKKAEMLATEKQLEMIKNLYSVEEVDKMLVNLNKNFYEITVQEASKMIKARKDKQNGSN